MKVNKRDSCTKETIIARDQLSSLESTTRNTQVEKRNPTYNEWNVNNGQLFNNIEPISNISAILNFEENMNKEPIHQQLKYRSNLIAIRGEQLPRNYIEACHTTLLQVCEPRSEHEKKLTVRSNPNLTNTPKSCRGKVDRGRELQKVYIIWTIPCYFYISPFFNCNEAIYDTAFSINPHILTRENRFQF